MGRLKMGVVVLLALGVACCGGAVRAQDAGAASAPAQQDGQAPDGGNAPAPAQNSAQPSGQAPGQQNGEAAAKKPSAGSFGGSASATNPTGTAADGSGAAQEAGGMIHTLANSVTIQLSTNWGESASNEVPPPSELRNYAPPFHLTSILSLQNTRSQSILQLAMSDNPLIGHDSNWLDEQMHMPAGSGMSVLDLMYYYFFPPTQQCMIEAQNTVAKATFAPSPAVASAAASGAPTPSSTDGTNPELQLTYHCRRDNTLDGFYATQLSNGITFVQSNSGPRAFSVVPQFYLAPMDRIQSQGITWFIFEAQRTDPVSQGAMTRFGLPASLQGAQPDYYWAIGAPDPFPFTADTGAPGQRLIHVGYASVGVGNNRRTEFERLLQRVQVKAAAPAAQ
jgi:hypothetical protein